MNAADAPLLVSFGAKPDITLCCKEGSSLINASWAILSRSHCAMNASISISPVVASFWSTCEWKL